MGSWPASRGDLIGFDHFLERSLTGFKGDFAGS